MQSSLHVHASPMPEFEAALFFFLSNRPNSKVPRAARAVTVLSTDFGKARMHRSQLWTVVLCCVQHQDVF